MSILLFIDQNTKTIPWEVPLLAMQQKGYTVHLLTILAPGPIHEEYQALGFRAHSMGRKCITLKHTLLYAAHLRRFCTRAGITIVHAHFSIPALAAILARPFMSTVVCCFRHHYNLVLHTSQAAPLPDRLLDKTIIRLAPRLIVPGSSLARRIQKNEKAPAGRLVAIPYAYDWKTYKKTSDVRKPSAPHRLRLLTVSRLTPLKRPVLSVQVLEQLLAQGCPAQLTIIGHGVMEASLQKYIEATKLEDKIIWVKPQRDIRPFYLKADVLLHPSLTEASSSVVKEAGVMGCMVVACAGVGDFDDYLQHGRNALLLKPENFVEEAVHLLKDMSAEYRQQLASNLAAVVEQRFSLSEAVVQQYEALAPAPVRAKGI